MKRNSNENNFGLEEEKKESSPRREARTDPKLEVSHDGLITELTKTVCKDEKIGLPDSTLEGLDDGLPSELKNRSFKDEGQLWETQELLGLSDLDIVLDSEGYACWREMPESIHAAAVGVISGQFLYWVVQHFVAQQLAGQQRDALCGNSDANLFLPLSFDQKMKRCPDFAIWGPDRMDGSGKTAMGNVELEKLMNPHVIFQFSWGNTLDNEKLAIDDMSVYAGTGEFQPLRRPNVLYLIKAIRKGSSLKSAVIGFDVYVVRQDERTVDATMEFRVGADDYIIEVDPVDMGLPQGTNPFSFALSEIRAAMERIGVVFEAEN